MVPNQETTSLGLKYFCDEGDALWRLSNEVEPYVLPHGTVVRVKKAYPVYDCYHHGLAAVREFLAMVPNLQVAGRNGMHRYNSPNLPRLTGILAARNTLGERYDLWQVNESAAYLEDGLVSIEPGATSSTKPPVPGRVASAGDWP